MKLQLHLQRLDHLSEKLISNFYFDYNATAPFAENVKSELAKGAFYCNPSAFYASGKRSKALIDQTKNFLQRFFNTADEVIFHSGATEGINLIIKGSQPSHFIYVGTDHSAVQSCAEFLAQGKTQVHEVGVNSEGEILYSQLTELLKTHQAQKVLVNITWVNNETGVVADLSQLKKLKEQYQFILHIDGAQAPGKIADYKNVASYADALTFSGHKFGALTGIGFSFIKKSLALIPQIHGGGQQLNLRSGTENTLGIYTLQLALEELAQKFNPEQLAEAKNYLENSLKNELGEQIIVTGEKATRNLNTINLIFKRLPSDQMLMMFDMKKIELSAGSACSSGRLKPSRVLTKMGFGNLAQHGLRFSFSPTMTKADAKLYNEAILSVFKQVK